MQDRLCAPSMPGEELYDLEADPHEVRNLASSPEHAGTLRRLRAALEAWIEETGDRGKALEPADLAARKGVTKKGTNPNRGYSMVEEEGGKKAGKKAAKEGGKKDAR